MKMLAKKVFIPSMVLSLTLLTGCRPDNNASKANLEIKTDEDKTVYAVGLMLGERLKDLRLSDDELSKVMLGITDQVKNVTPQKADFQEYRMKVQSLFQDRMKASAQIHKEAGKQFIEKFVTSEGGVKTASGLAYKVITPGDESAKPLATDTVEVHYEGKLIDGTVFDSSLARDKKIKFPLNRVIKGWTEGLQFVGKGGKIKLVIPSDMAYGDHGAPPKIPGGSTLVFEVELFEIEKTPATPAMPGMPETPAASGAASHPKEGKKK